MSAFARIRSVLSAGVLLASVASCSDSNPPEDTGPCRADEECASDERCVDGVCESALCDGGACGEDAGADATDDVAQDAAEDADADADDGSGDAGRDVIFVDAEADSAPQIPVEWSITPADGATGVALDATIEIVFNQAMNAFRFIPSNFELTPFDGEEVERSLAYFEETFTLTISPPSESDDLLPLTPYTLHISDFVASADGQELGTPAFVTFATTTFDGRAGYEALARAYAPIVLQEVDEPRLDVPTRVDFDSDFELANNLESARAPGPSFAYFDVVESRTHFFVSYLFYYPGSIPRTGIEFEHDWVIAQLVVQKTDEGEPGALRAFATVYHENFNLWRLDPSTSPAGQAPEAGSEDFEGTLDRSDLVDERRPTLFVEGGRHGVCLPDTGTIAGPCAPAEGSRAPFAEEAQALTLSIGDVADRWDGVGSAALSYRLLSFAEAFWALRDRSRPEDGFFGGERSYRAPSVGDDARPGDGATFPASLLSDNAAGAFGDLPFILQSSIEPTSAGVWFVDPAFFWADALTFPETFAISYCFNLYLGIDERGRLDGCPAPTEPESGAEESSAEESDAAESDAGRGDATP